jgi:hypothetical protein
MNRLQQTYPLSATQAQSAVAKNFLAIDGVISTDVITKKL